MAPRTVKPVDVRRSEIVAAAADLFASRGYARTTMTDILRATGLTKGGLYHHFASKEAVFTACVQQVANGLSTRFVEALDDDALRPRERVRAYIRLGYTDGDETGTDAIVHELHVHGGDDLHARVIDGVQEQVLPAFARAIDEGRRQGDYAFDGDPDVVAVGVIGMLRAVHERYASVPRAAELVPPELVISMVERALGVRSAGEEKVP